MNKLIISCLFYAATNARGALAFTKSPSIRPRALTSSFNFMAKSTESQDIVDDYDVTCYVVNDEEIITEGEKPHVVCTSEPDDYAWFNGIERSNMRETDSTMGTDECVEGESFRGNPEWDCE